MLKKAIQAVGSKIPRKSATPKAQTYLCNYSVQIKNVSETDKKLEIYIPVASDFSGQKLIAPAQFRPEPAKVYPQLKGAGYAHYRIDLKSHHSITLNQYFTAAVQRPQEEQATPEIEKAVKNEKIQKIAADLEKTNPTEQEFLKAANAHVKDFLQFDKELRDYCSAKAALENEKTNASGFANVLIEILKQKNIACYPVTGFILRPDQEVLENQHVWVEALIEGKIITLDPLTEKLEKANSLLKRFASPSERRRIILTKGAGHTLKVDGKAVKIDLFNEPIVLDKAGDQSNLKIRTEFINKRDTRRP
ncbi:MAG: transglutaminase domain-containing protein [Candidatus Paceibacterota bacterium]